MFRRKTFELAHHRFKLASFEEKSIEYQHPVKPMAELITWQIQNFNKWLPSVVNAKVQDYLSPFSGIFSFRTAHLLLRNVLWSLNCCQLLILTINVLFWENKSGLDAWSCLFKQLLSWVPETFHARFPVSVILLLITSLYSRFSLTWGSRNKNGNLLIQKV